jgi:hypothetical protein
MLCKRRITIRLRTTAPNSIPGTNKKKFQRSIVDFRDTTGLCSEKT